MRKINISKKAVALSMAMVLAFGCGVGGTLAWLTAQTSEVENVFTTSDIGVGLVEHTYDADKDKLTSIETTTGVNNYKMVPGWIIPKDPKTWITEGSEDAYLFVKVEKSENFDKFMEYSIVDSWTELTSAEGTNYKVYYREVASGNTGKEKGFNILEGDQVTVRGTVTKEMMEMYDGVVDETNLSDEQIAAAKKAEIDGRPTLTFTAYAHQLYQSSGTPFDAAVAWTNLNSNTSATN